MRGGHYVGVRRKGIRRVGRRISGAVRMRFVAVQNATISIGNAVAAPARDSRLRLPRKPASLRDEAPAHAGSRASCRRRHPPATKLTRGFPSACLRRDERRPTLRRRA